MKNVMLTILFIMFSLPVFAWQNVNQLQGYNYKFVSGTGVVTIKSGSGILHTVTVEGGTSGTIDLFDSTTASGTTFSSFTATNTPQTYTYDVAFSSGVTVNTGASLRILFSYL